MNQVLEREKHKNLSGTQGKSVIDNAPGWNDLLASASEAVVKVRVNLTANSHARLILNPSTQAERAATPEDLQAATVEAIQTRHDPDERPSGGAATYKSDTIEGPLSSARLTQTTTTSENGRTTTTKLEEVVTKQ
jgi:hypothetical protein